jgi:hypothetical protein
MPDIEFIRGEIERKRLQVLRQRREIMQLQRAGLAVQAIIVAIDQYAEAATGNRDFFLNKLPGARRGDVP